MDVNDLNKILEHLKQGKHLDEKAAVMVLRKLMEVLYEEPNVVKLNAPITVVGDIHGQLFDLFEMFRISGEPDTTKYLFLGDYVDRGYFSLETFLYVATLKLKYPTQICLLRGNHESRQVSKQYGFYDECVFNYGHGGIWNLCQECFDLLPLAAVIDNRVFCVHGGLSPNILLIDQISMLERQQEIPITEPIADLLWSDPTEHIQLFGSNDRGSGCSWGRSGTERFIRAHNFDAIIPISITTFQRWAFIGFNGPTLTIKADIDIITERIFECGSNVKEIRFLGHANQIDSNAFSGLSLSVIYFLYPVQNASLSSFSLPFTQFCVFWEYRSLSSLLGNPSALQKCSPNKEHQSTNNQPLYNFFQSRSFQFYPRLFTSIIIGF